MKSLKLNRSASLVFAGLAAGLLATSSQAMEPQVIELSQTPCQFVEVEEKDHGFSSTQKSDCVAINDKTSKERLAKSKVLKLKPGDYVFRVSNKSVSYDLGFWIRGATLLTRATLPSVSGGGLTQGTHKDYKITLTTGEYVFSCPLNNTPDYSLIVEDS